jgi:hypothetical protein
MTNGQTVERQGSSPLASRSRSIKFTPERLQQIINLVERGKSRYEIAEIIGVTTGTLQVICSRLGISLRRPTFNNGIVSLRRNETRLNQTPGSGDDSDSAHPIKEPLERNSKPEPAEPAQSLAPRQEVKKMENEAGAARFAIRMQYRGEKRTTELPLSQEMIGQLAFEAAFRNVSMGELIGEIIVAVLKQDLLQTALEC